MSTHEMREEELKRKKEKIFDHTYLYIWYAREREIERKKEKKKNENIFDRTYLNIWVGRG